MKILKVLSLCVLLLLSSKGFAQKKVYDVDLTGTFIKNISYFKKGDTVNFDSLRCDSILSPDDFGLEMHYFLTLKNKKRSFVIMKKIKNYVDFKCKDINGLCDANILIHVLNNLEKKGHQYELRKEMEDEALDYIYKVKEYNLELKDPYLYDYIYSLLLKMTPDRYIDGRFFDVNVLIQQSEDINACMYPNGTMVINTGLLSVLHSEDELVAILAHEFGHFLMDHSIVNVNKAEARKKRAAFWAAVATGITAVAEGVAASNQHYYTPGLGTLAMAGVATEISRQVVEHLGMKYNQEQEFDADMFAVEVLKLLGYDKNALATALERIGKNCSVEDKYAMYLSSYTHPDLLTRIKKVGVPSDLYDTEYEQKVSFAVSNVAMIKFVNRRFRQCIPFVSQNIENNVANADDYLLKANCILATKNSSESNNEVAELISKAKGIDPNNINILKCEIQYSFRLNDKAKAINLLEEYCTALNSIDIKTGFVIEEIKWAEDMLIKLKGMCVSAAA